MKLKAHPSAMEGASTEGSGSIEEQLLDAAKADREKLAELGKLLFMLNGFKPGPLANRYAVLCTKPDREWCVAQLWADLEKPFRLVEGMRFSSAEQAEQAALALQKRGGDERGGSAGAEEIV